MREREIFIEALQKTDPAERLACLDAACAGDDRLRQCVLRLLAEHEKNESFFLDAPAPLPAGPFVNGTVDQHATETPGHVIDPYKLLEQIGEGGMGTVWMAQQFEPIKRLVALKLIKAGMDSKAVLARFEAERQALALMDHPNIAKVHDAGTTQTGRPFFVMELIKGVPITGYCDEHRLTPRQRLELFVPVCHAVQHAHQKGIIHRDLKPSNVLVALYDGKPVPKVIDFGVAKAAGQSLTEKTLVTGFGAIVGTLEYMSPEQAEINQLDIDTRSDIYSLGVLLYELLTGSPPFTRKELEKAGMLEMLRVIREQEPSKPSTKLSTAEGLPTLAANRGTEPAKLTKLVRGELDWIVMKTLEKDRNRRYKTANGLAADVQRYLADEPVQACPPSAGYRFRKFARRNKVALTTAALVVVSLMAVMAALVISNVRIAQEQGRTKEALDRARVQRDEADANLQKAREAGEEFFTRVSESRLLDEPGLQPLRKELLEAAAAYYERLATREGDDPRALTDLALSQLRLAQIYTHAGFGDRHIAALEEGIKRSAKLIGEHPEAADLHLRLAGFWHGGRSVGGTGNAQTDQRAALRVYQDAAELWEKLCQRHANVVGFRNDLSKFYDCQANTHEALGHVDEAVRMEKRVCEIREQIVGAQPGVYEHVAELGHAYVHLARLLETTDPQAAEDLFRRGLDLQKDAPDVATYQEFLALQQRAFGVFLARRNRPEGALAAYRQAVAVYQKLARRFPHVTSYREALNAWQGEINDLQRPSSKIASTCLERGQLLYQNSLGKPQEAEAAFREAQAHYEKLVKEYPADHSYRIGWADSHTWLAWVLMDTQRWEEAEKALRRALAIRQELLDLAPADPFRRLIVVHSHLHLGALLAEAECLSRFGQRRPPSRILLAAKLGEVRRFQEAEQEFRQCVDICEKLLVEFPDNQSYQNELAVSRYFLAGVLAARGRGAEASAAYRQSVADYKVILDNTPGTAGHWFLLAAAYCQLGEKEKARPWYDRAVEWLENSKSRDAVLHRLHAEGAELLGLPAPPKGGNVASKEKLGLESK